MSNCCYHGTLPHFSLQGSHLNICYFHQDLHQRLFHPASLPRLRYITSTPAYSLICNENNINGEVWVIHLSAIHFQGQFIRPLSCYTLLSGFRLPWPPCGCLDELTPFVVSDKCIFRHLNSAFGSSHIASSAYQKWPTKDFYSCTSSIKKQVRLTYLKFENRLRTLHPQGL